MTDENLEASDQMSVASDASDIERFEDYKPKLKRLLEDLKFPECSIESLQHGYSFQNCVYALTSLAEPTDQYIVRVPGFDKENEERCSEIDDGVCVLNYLKDKMPVPVPKIITFSATPDNSIENPYTIQTRLAGQSLDHVYSSLDSAERRGMIDNFIDLLAKIESIRFSTAGSLVAPYPLPTDTGCSSDIPAPSIKIFNEGDTDPIEDRKILADRAGSDIKLLFKSLIAKYIAADLQSIADGYNGFRLPYWRRMETMLDEMEQEGFFRTAPEPIVMHHWDLEARNVMVAKTNGEWKITGVIDWDEPECVPRPIARKPPAWFWTWSDSDEDTSSDESDCDQYPDRELSETDAALKAYFDQKVEEILAGYLEDAYGTGRMLRRLWTFIKDGLNKQWTVPVCEQLLDEWEARPRSKKASSRKELKLLDPVPVSPAQAELASEQPLPEGPKPERSDGAFVTAVKRGWRRAFAWFSIRR